MTSRLLQAGGTTYSQAWDAENRLVSVTVGGQTTAFTYDGDGALVKKVANGQTTAYVGNYYEKQGTAVSKYYYFAGQRVAMRTASVLSYLAGDHLGTTSLTWNSSGAKVAEARHLPYGGERWASGTMPTDYRFTGQRLTASLGLYQMGARWFDPALGRWISPDSIIPDFSTPQSLNRYSYAIGNPLNLTDPSGHIAAKEEKDARAILTYMCSTYGICLEVDFGYVPYESPGPDDPPWMWEEGEWELHQLEALRDTADYAARLYFRYQADEITSLDFMCSLTDYRASIGSPETFVDDISTFLLGERGGRAIWAPPLHANRWKQLVLDASGFSAYHQDNSNQARHFWMYAHAAYTTGMSFPVTLGNKAHETPWLPGIGGPGASEQDYLLGNRGRDLGMALRAGTVDYNEVGDWIRRRAGGGN